MTDAPLTSLPRIADVEVIRGARAEGPPQFLFEMPHGATRAAHFDELRAELHGDYPSDLRDFFFVNTDVGAPELARRTAEKLVAARPKCSAVLLTARIPRTFVDCNRAIDPAAKPSASGMTPGLHTWVRDPRDRALLLARHAAYRELAQRAFDRVCGAGGLGVMLHTYAPRSIDVPVDDRVVEHLRAAYRPETIGSWPLRPAIDLIAATPDGRVLADENVLAAVRREGAALGLEVATNGTYPLHPSTLAFVFAERHPQKTLCLEVRRDLLVREFTPFAEMLADEAKVEPVSNLLAAAIGQVPSR